MPINVSNMVVNLGQTQGFDWGNLLTVIIGATATLVAAAVGAYGGSYFKEKQNKEASKKHQKELLKHSMMLNKNLFINMQSLYNCEYIDFIISIKANQINYDIDLQKYLFLAEYNEISIALFNELTRNVNLILSYNDIVKGESVPKSSIQNTLFYTYLLDKILFNISKFYFDYVPNKNFTLNENEINFIKKFSLSKIEKYWESKVNESLKGEQ